MALVSESSLPVQAVGRGVVVNAVAENKGGASTTSPPDVGTWTANNAALSSLLDSTIFADYRFNAGELLVDSSTVGTDNALSNIGGVIESASGIRGSCASIDGAANMLNIEPTPTDFNYLTEHFAISCWIKPDSATPAADAYFVSTMNGVGARQLALGLKSNGSFNVNLNFSLFNQDTSIGLATTNWTHILLTVRNIVDNADRQVKLFVNGVVEIDEEYASDLDDADVFGMGRFWTNTATIPTNTYKGLIDEFWTGKSMDFSSESVVIDMASNLWNGGLGSFRK